MKRPALLVASQVLLLALGLVFPIVFVRFNGHALFGTVALAATYSAVALSVVVTGLSQSILSHGLALRRLSLYALALSAAAAAGWLVQVLALPRNGPTVYLTAVWMLAAQAAVSFIYYYAVRRRLMAVLTFVMPGEALARIAAAAALHGLHLGGATVLAGCYVISNLAAGLIALAVIVLGAPAEDPDAGGRLRLDAAGRFMRWSASGTVLDGFDRGGYGALLNPQARSPFLFFDTLYLAAFGLIANTARMEVLAARPGGRVATKAALLLLVAGGVGAAAAATAALFALAGPLGRWTGFDPRPVAGAVIFAFAYRSALFVQFVAYGYVERAGRTPRTIGVRLAATAGLAGLMAVSGAAPLSWIAGGAVLIAAAVAAQSLVLALADSGPAAAPEG